MSGFIEKINQVAAKLGIIEEANNIFDEGVIPVLEEIAALDLSEAIVDLKKGTFFGNRKIDIDLSLNKVGITEGMSTVAAMAIWEDTTTTVYYSSATVTFVDGMIVNVPFVNDDLAPINISNHGTLVVQLMNNLAFTTKLTETGIIDDIGGETGVLVRVYDIVGQTSNIERIQLHAVAGSYVDQNPVYYWGKTTSAFQTLSMRTADIIKLGNDIDSIIILANRITEMLALQERIPEFVTNPDSLYTNIAKLVAIHAQLAGIVSIYNDIKVGGTNYINTAGADLLLVDSKIITVATDLQLGNLSTLKIVKDAIAHVIAVSGHIANVDTVATNIAKVDTVAAQNANINTLIANLIALQNASANAASAAASAQTATDKSNEIKNVSVGTTSTGAAGSLANVVYNPLTGKFSFVIPQGVKGDKGDAFAVNAVGLIAGRTLYDAQAQGFSFLAIDQALIYFKLSATSGDWSVGAPFGKGDKGDIGNTGNGILDIQFSSTTHVSGLAAQSGGVDTYTITYTDTTTDEFIVRNGLDGVLINDATLSLIATWSSQKISDALAAKADAAAVTLALADKADAAAVTLALADKADADAVALALADKADADAVALALADKQDTLVSGGNIKTIGGVSVLGAGDISIASIPSITAGMKVINSSTTFIAPFTGTIKVTAIGAGASGGACVSGNGTSCSATGGSAGGFAQKTFNVNQGDEFIVTIGAGGAQFTTADNLPRSGNNGGNTLFIGGAINIVANGGIAGTANKGVNGTLNGSSGGMATGGDINHQGGKSGNAINTNTGYCVSATGGAAVSVFGVSADSGNASATAYGAQAASGGSGVFPSGYASNTNGSNFTISIGGGAFGRSSSMLNAVVAVEGDLVLGDPSIPIYFNSDTSTTGNAGAGSSGSFSGSSGAAKPFGGSGGVATASSGNSGTAGIGSGSGGVANYGTNMVTVGKGGNGIVFIEYEGV